MSQYIIYCRKSSESEERQVLSIESQTKELKELATRLNLPVSEILSESRSAKSPGRTVFGLLMKKVARKEIEGIICWKLDRLARNPIDGAEIVWALDQGNLDEIITPYNHLTNNSNDKFLMQLEFGIAKKYVDDLSDNVRRGIRMKLEKGWLPGRAPLGYLNEPKERTIVPDPERFTIVRKMWELLLEGISPFRICQFASDKLGLRGRTRLGKRVSISTIYKLFANPFYYGLIKRKGNFYHGKHEPIITEDEFWKAQKILGRKGIPRPKTHTFAFTGLIRCGECGCSITAEEKVNRYGSHYTYYRCTKKKRDIKCSQKTISASELENQMKSYLAKIYVPQSLLEICINYMKEEQKKSHEQDGDIRASLEKSYNNSVRGLDNLNQMRLRDLIDDEEYLSAKRKLLDEKIRLENNLEASKNGNGTIHTIHNLSDNAFTFANEALKRFESGTPGVKKSIIQQIGSNFLLKDKKLSIEVVKPFSLIEKTLKSFPHSSEELELPENKMNTDQSGFSHAQFLVWCG